MTSARPCVGVLGGSFDPPHVGHLALASEACEALGLDEVLFVPAAAPPHKEDSERTPAPVRFELARSAVGDDPRFTVCDIEMERGLVYTTDLLRALAADDPERDLVFLLGSDSLLQLETWHEPEELVRLSEIAVAPRPGDSPEAIAAAVARWGEQRVTLLDLPLFGVSSSGIRARIAAGRPVRYLVPRAVEERIDDLGLYQ